MNQDNLWMKFGHLCALQDLQRLSGLGQKAQYSDDWRSGVGLSI